MSAISQAQEKFGDRTYETGYGSKRFFKAG